MAKFSGLALTSLALLPAALGMTRAGVRDTVESRRLSFEKFAQFYEPNSQVTDHAAIDLDQAAIETQLALATDESFAAAKAIYQEGGYSKSYAQVKLTAPLTSNVSKGTAITGKNDDGTTINGKAYEDLTAGQSEIKIQYFTGDLLATYVDCQVGALVDPNTNGCFTNSGAITIGSEEYGYTYNKNTDNNNGRTIQGFSTGAEKKMFNGCPGCPYKPYKEFFDYYGQFDYANQWVLAALDGTQTSFTKGNADFSKYTFTGRTEAVKKGTAYMNIYMYVIREFYDAIDDCQSGCINCNDDPVHAWDEGVAFYTGSTESKLGYTLGEKRCANFKTCGNTAKDASLEGTAKINYDLMDQFHQGQYNLLVGNCAAAKVNANRIVDLMAVPLIQGTMRYAYKVDRLQGEEKEKAEGAVFAAAVLPKLNACNADDAQTVYNNMRVGAFSTNFNDVKAAFENNHKCLGIICDDIGGLWNDATDGYYVDAEPCRDRFSVANRKTSPLALGLGIAGGCVGVIALLFVGYMIKREKTGKPLFEGEAKTMA